MSKCTNTVLGNSCIHTNHYNLKIIQTECLKFCISWLEMLYYLAEGEVFWNISLWTTDISGNIKKLPCSTFFVFDELHHLARNLRKVSLLKKWKNYMYMYTHILLIHGYLASLHIFLLWIMLQKKKNVTTWDDECIDCGYHSPMCM